MTHGHHEHEQGHDHEHEHDAMQECIEACLNTHAACTMAVQHCLGEGGERADIDLVGVLLDCAELCQTSANFMLRGSPYHGLVCAACAELCRACEEACRSISGDEQLAECAEMCATSADRCEAMANADEAEGDED